MKSHTLLIVILFTAACLGPDSSDQKQELVNVYEGPTTFFHNACAKCHGENGSEYQESIPRNV
ncbi:MAG: hypothetical protein ACP5I1_09035 [Candidatus Hinthialibacter sp.]